MALEVTIFKAENLINLEKVGKSDPFVILEFQGVKKKTTVISNNLNPEWNEKFVWEIKKQPPLPDDNLSILVKDYERVGRNRLMGEATLLLRNVLESNQPLEFELTLFDHNQRPTAGTLFLTVGYSKPEECSVPEKSLQQMTDESKTDTSISMLETTQTSDVLRREAFNIALPKQITKFQVRVRVVEARHLIGASINPVCQVILSQLPKQTEVAKATNNPYWNNIFFFHKECLPLDLYKEFLEFKVKNARAFRSNMLIGSFKLSLGQIYSQQGHAYFNKWLLLSSEEEEDSVTEVMGYLKISVAVIGPGDTTPDLSLDSGSETDDAESNLLLPTGTQLKPATFHIDLFQAADLPRMDPGVMEGVKKILNIEDKKELIDPYLEASFAGNKVTSRIIYGDDNPCWNERLFTGFQFPSVCENIQLTLKDWDRVSEDDIVAMAHIPVPQISASGATGFLPCFGPAWVNFYGAPREYKVFGSKLRKLNEDASAGCSFRGRALISIRTELGSYPDAKSVLIPTDDTLRVQFYCRRRRFRLHATFLDATMVKITDAPVEFEISIGNFGNKFEDRLTPSPSTTPPTNAVFDGCQYYYLPWKDVKPSLIITSQWEDVAFRLETLNLLFKVIENMENEIQVLKNRVSDTSIFNYQDPVMSLVNKFLDYTNITLPEPVLGQQKENELDRLLRIRRMEEITNLREQAKILRESGCEINEAIQELESMVQEIKSMTVEPQNSIPDVIIWMISGKKRIAYERIPSHLILFSPDVAKSGKYCGRVQTLLLKSLKHEKDFKIPAMVRLKLWFGLEIYEKYWKSQETADLTAYAETYENQVNVLGKWITKGPTMTRPAWSDSSGSLKLHPDKFVLPTGWRFDGDWFISPEPSLKFEDDAGRRIFLEDVFENQNRLPGGPWIAATTTWTDIRGDPANPRDAIECSPGWEWHDVWEVDLHRAVDEEGWEYTIEATLGGYQPVEKTYHLCRRRRWVRQRNFIGVTEPPEEEDSSYEVLLNNDGGWEYSTFFNLRFHAKRRRMDLVRRRRWHRKLVTDDKSPHLAFSVLSDSEKANDDSKLSLVSCPVLSMEYKGSHKVQMRAYIYQARDLIAGDKTGFSDPYASVSFLNQSQKTEVMYKTLCPVWDQTLIFDGLTVFGDLTEIKEQPPVAVIELYDRDAHGDDEFLGRVLVTPTVQLDTTSIQSPPLKWHLLNHPTGKAGEILASFEFFVVDDNHTRPRVPPKRGNVFIVPAGIRPIVQLTAIEILCWGIRNMKTFELSPISCPSVEFECGGKVVQSKPIKDAKLNPNFDNPVLYLEMLLPQEPQYMPPLNIKVRDHRQFGRKPVVGTCVIKSLNDFFCQPHFLEATNEATQQFDTVDTVIEIPIENPENSSQADGSTAFDWWAKYYASIGDVSKSGQYLQHGYDTLQVFTTELEKVAPYHGFCDFLSTFSLKRGKTKVLEESNCVGEFKGSLRVYPLPSDPDKPRPQKILKTLPCVTREEIIVRIYIIKAQDLAPKDPNGKADPYIAVKLGKKKLDNRKQYKPNTLCPIFGEVFELSGTLPLDKDLTVSVWDYDLLNGDDLIGHTVIDLENRYLTKYRATCGLPLSYHTSGVNKWRDSKKPCEILEDVCILHNLPPPQFIGLNTVVIGKTSHTLDDFEKQPPESVHVGPPKHRLALHVLHSMNLVPEHVETRALYNPLSPDLQQGKLQMWVDIFPKLHGQPGPLIDVTPRCPLKYHLRAIIWNTYEVPLDETSIVGGESMSDIYVKCWLQGDDAPQKTDIHYRSMDGEGNFNWRMIFPFSYLPAENNIVVTRKKHFWSLDATEQHLPPKFSIQIWDNDKFSADDFLGSLEFPLTALPAPAKSIAKCGLHQLGIEEGSSDLPRKWNPDNSDGNSINLFEKKRIKGFWPCFTKNSEKGYYVAGKVEMELEMLSDEEASQKPAGLGRDEPNMNPKLEMPNRPSTSFLWLTSPWKSLKFILWKNYKWYCITILLIFLAVLLVIIFIYSFPEALAQRIVN